MNRFKDKLGICFHRRRKKNYPFGRNSQPTMVCKDCGKPVTRLELKNLKKIRRRKRY